MKQLKILMIAGTRVQSLKFKWGSEVYKIARVKSRWQVAGQGTRLYHFAIVVNGPDQFEIVFDVENFSWQLARIYLAG